MQAQEKPEFQSCQPLKSEITTCTKIVCLYGYSPMNGEFGSNFDVFSMNLIPTTQFQESLRWILKTANSSGSRLYVLQRHTWSSEAGVKNVPSKQNIAQPYVDEYMISIKIVLTTTHSHTHNIIREICTSQSAPSCSLHGQRQTTIASQTQPQTSKFACPTTDVTTIN